MNLKPSIQTIATSRIAAVARCLSAAAAIALLPGAARAAGILTPVGSPDLPVRLESHSLRVVINNGFARSEVEQVFYNPNPVALEAVYSAPVPERGALAELTIWAGDRVLQGEVVSKSEADRIYEEETSQGNSAAKADRNGYQDFEFAVYPVPAQGRVRMRYAYYEPLAIESGVGRYVYRLEEGGTDDGSEAFWTLGDSVESRFEIDLALKSAWPVARTRAPGFGGAAMPQEDGSLVYRYASDGARLDQDFVFYYMLEEDLPGRAEILTYRESEDKPGSFMLLLTPGEDLQPLSAGADFVFALDASGSMQGKLHTLVAGVKKALGQLRPEDRFRIVAFNTNAFELGGGWVHATPENAQAALARLDSLAASGSTNLYDGVRLALAKLDGDRVSSVILVTDGVANEGIVDPARFHKLLRDRDARFFGFLLGSGANWPLMELMCEASGGRYRAVSNSDDIVGEILLAKNAVAYESLRDAKLTINGVETFDVSNFRIGKIHRGQQLALFGRYESGGNAAVRLEARVGGETKHYETEIVFSDVDTRHPELERMWALDQVSKLELARLAGLVDPAESEVAIRDIGIAYQIVTDETSMIALDDASFARRGLDRRNLSRVAREEAARANPAATGAQRADAAKPMFSQRAPSVGGGALEPWMLCLVAAGALIWWSFARPRAAVARVASVVLAAAALGAGAARADDGSSGAPRWTDRDLSVDSSRSSIDHSIANFWGVSEEEARAPAARRVDPVEVCAPRSARDSDRSWRVDYPDTHRVTQSRARSARRGHFGLNLFNIVPVFDFVWGDSSQSETDRYDGEARR